MHGRAKCKILKEIRQAIADENDIPYITRECTYKGDCSGTCPKCESELHYLESELEKRRRLGKNVVVSALCSGLILCTTACAESDPFDHALAGMPEMDTPPYDDGNDTGYEDIELAGAAEEWPEEEYSNEAESDVPESPSDAYDGLKVFASTFNTNGVYNKAQSCPLYTAEDNVTLRALCTYHWNGGNGAEPGVIRIYDITDKEETLIGSWEATARGGSGASNVYWDIFPDIELQKGHKYHIKDSDPETWSNNEKSDYMGFVELYTDETANVNGGGFKFLKDVWDKLIH